MRTLVKTVTSGRRRAAALLAGAVVASLLTAGPPLASPAQAAPTTACDAATYPSAEWVACEAANVGVTGQNATRHLDLLPGILASTSQYQLARFRTMLTDPERQPNVNSCTTIVLCPIDPRVQGWTAKGGLVEPVLYTSRSGATMSGHVWATRTGPAKRPGVVVINGSVVGFEEIYWYLAQTLARSGFVVMTFDVQGEGMSDQFGAKPDQLEDAFAGIPLLGLFAPKGSSDGPIGLGGNGLAFYDGGQDALDFFLSTPAKPYVPRVSRISGTSHAAKQVRRVAAGRNAAYNPLWNLLDGSRIGLTGHSYGAVATSWLTQKDPRVSTGVALDNLCVPVSPAPDELAAFSAPNPDFSGRPDIMNGLPTRCFEAPPGPAPRITKPALGINGDYLLAPVPFLAPPNPLGKSRASLAYSRAGVDTGQITIRGGTHFDFNDVPAALPASLRGIDQVAWYTSAWFDKYLDRDPTADARLLTRRWQSDARARSADPTGDGNLFSWHFRSRLDIHTAGGTRYRCENLRAGCAGMTPASGDGWSGDYDFVAGTIRAR